VQLLPTLLPHLSWQVAPGEQSSTPSFVLFAEAVQVAPDAQLKLHALGPEQLKAQLQLDEHD
jgi:hypothetical protein